MDSISAVERRAVPKQIEVMDKNKVMNFASGLEPRIEIEESAKTLWALGHGWQGTTDKNGLLQLFKMENRSSKSRFVSSVCDWPCHCNLRGLSPDIWRMEGNS